MLRKHILFFTGLVMVLATKLAFALPIDSLLRHTEDPYAGNSKGKVTIVEFFDYQCSHCVAMSSIVADIIKTNPNVRIVFKELPIRGPLSEFAARAALAANKQNKYYSFNHALFAINGPLNEEIILKTAKKAGLSLNKLKKDMQSTAISDQIRANYRLARELDLTGTPAFFIAKTNEKNKDQMIYILGEATTTQLQEAIQKMQQ